MSYERLPFAAASRIFRRVLRVYVVPSPCETAVKYIYIPTGMCHVVYVLRWVRLEAMPHLCLKRRSYPRDKTATWFFRPRPLFPYVVSETNS